jgi:hypothetical protein
MADLDIRTVSGTRYVLPLREGGSLPGIVEANDGFKYVLKFRGAGQGIKALIAEILGYGLAKALELPIPELVFAQMDEGFGRTEPDEEIQDLLKASVGLNVGLHYLSGSITFDPVATPVDATIASRIVWLDAFIMNVDRTIKNTNLLVFDRKLWLIDHGASFYFHHNIPDDIQQTAQNPFAMIKNHVFLPLATELEAADEWAHKKLSEEKIKAIVALIPDEFLTIAQVPRNLYEQFLITRFNESSNFVKFALNAR